MSHFALKNQVQKSRIAIRVRNMNIILLALVLLLITAMVAVITHGINNDNARNLSRSHAIEAAKLFYSYISEDLTLVRKASYSKAITDWCADEGNEAKKALAFDEMMDYIAILQQARLYLGINKSRNEYTIERHAGLKDFVPVAKLDQSAPDDAWYFECISSENEYAINIGIDRFYYTWYLWINHRIISDGNLTGVFCSGLRIPDMYREMFGNYDEKNTRGYVIDKHGVVQLSSTTSGIYSKESKSRIREENDDPAFAEALHSYLGKIDCFFSPHSPIEVIKLAKGPSEYVSIAPIAGSDWSVVVFYDSNFLSSIAYLLPLLIVMLVALFLYGVGRNALITALIFSPLDRLTRDVSEGNYGNSIFGSDRDDEIGELARTIRDASQQRQHQQQLLHAVNSAAGVLLAPVGEADFRASLLEGMDLIGHCVDVDRVNIWRNEMIDGDLCYVLQYDWIDGSSRQGKPNPIKSTFSYRDNPEWKEKFSRGEYINGPLSSLSQNDQIFLQPYEIKSILMIPVHLEEKFWGIVCFDDCHRERTFTKDEIDILRSGSLMMVSALNRSMQAKQLGEAQQNTQVLLDAMPLTIQLWHRDGQMFDCNEETVKLFKVKDKQEFIDRFFDLSPKYQDDGRLSRDKVLEFLPRVFDKGRCVFEWMHQTIDGTPLPSEITLVRVKFGNEYVAASYVRDLREYKQMMQEIEQRDRLLNTVNSAATILLQSETDEFENDVKKCMGMMGEAVGVDRVSLWKNDNRDDKLFCTRIHEWVGTIESPTGNDRTVNIPYEENVSDWIKILSQGNCINNIVRNMSLKEQKELGPRGILSIFVAPIFVRDQFWGFIVYANCQQEKIFSENEYSILRSGSLIIANALLRNDMALSIRSGAAKLQDVIANYPGIIWSVERNNRITLFNGQYLKDLGITSASYEGKMLDDAMQESRFAEISRNIKKTFTEGPQDLNSEVMDRMYRIRTRPIFDDSGNVVNVMGSFDDITERTRLQAELKVALATAQQANSAKSNFLANMSHEMRTPLNAIIGLSELTLGIDSLDGESFSNLEKINNAGMTLLSTVNDILDISKIEAGKFELVPVEYDIPSLLNDTVTQSILHAGEKPIQFCLDITENLPTRLYGDDLRVKQILNNLLSNAFKYTKEGKVELGVSCEREGATVWLSARVRDTGLGIRSKDLGELFTDYAQMDTKTNRKIEGTGLGLPITKRIVEMMGGSIAVESEYGKGSVFTIRIRQQFVTDSVIGTEVANSLKNFRYSDQKRRKNSRMARISLPYARVLVVDDVQTNLDVAKGMMKPYGMKIDCVTSGQDAIDAIRNEKVKYNAIFMDHMMPGMDGIEATRIIRKEIGTDYAKTVPMIALTANAIVGNAEMFLQNGFQAFISKPIEIGHLDSVIREWVRDKTISEEHTEKPKTVQGFLFHVEGIDLQKGLERFSGDEESFLQVLRSYAVNTPSLLEVLKGVNRDNLADYAIAVHGVKGSSRGICAEIVGAKAEVLEKAAKEGNYNFVMSNNTAFLRDVEKLIDELNGFLQQLASDSPKPKKGKPDRELLLKLLDACQAYNMDGVDTAMKEIEDYEYEGDDGLAVWLRENVDRMNFAQIREKLIDITG